MDKKGIYDICLALIPTECREWILCAETYGFLGSMSHQLNQMCQNNKTKQNKNVKKVVTTPRQMLWLLFLMLFLFHWGNLTSYYHELFFELKTIFVLMFVKGAKLAISLFLFSLDQPAVDRLFLAFVKHLWILYYFLGIVLDIWNSNLLPKIFLLLLCLWGFLHYVHQLQFLDNQDYF